MNLKATQLEYEFRSRDGHGLKVVVTEMPGRGWSATVTMASEGLATPDAAMESLRADAKAFIRMLDERKEDA